GRVAELALDERIGGGFAAAPAPVVVRLLPAADGHYYVDGQLEGNPVRFLVDTGATTIAINKHTARRIGLQYRVDGRRGNVETAAGPAPAFAVTFDEVKVQAIRLTDVPGVVVDGDAPREPLLGQAVLNRLDISRTGTVMELRAR
ncbi:MAG: TIGR02281 family clan AA aspartic protease, partial [Gammaproteobacteria bacterium]